MIKMDLPPYIINWVWSFLESRSFCVNVNGQKSKEFPIKAGVPQGSVISPLLFSIFINDIPKKDKTNSEYSLLFADDLVTFFIFKSKRNIELRVNTYLKELEPWLAKWKMKISIEKSCYMVFTKSTRNEPNLNLKINGDNLHRQDEIKFLGIRFDPRLTFSPLIDELKERCNSRLNLIKILSNKNWGLDHKTLGSLYKSLIGSIVDYTFPCLNSLSDTNLKKLQTIQNSAVRSILKLRFDTPSSILYQEAQNKLKINTIANRLFELSERYVRVGLGNSVPLLTILVSEYRRGFESRFVNYPTPLCNCYFVLDSYFSTI